MRTAGDGDLGEPVSLPKLRVLKHREDRPVYLGYRSCLPLLGRWFGRERLAVVHDPLASGVHDRLDGSTRIRYRESKDHQRGHGFLHSVADLTGSLVLDAEQSPTDVTLERRRCLSLRLNSWEL